MRGPNSPAARPQVVIRPRYRILSGLKRAERVSLRLRVVDARSRRRQTCTRSSRVIWSSRALTPKRNFYHLTLPPSGAFSSTSFLHTGSVAMIHLLLQPGADVYPYLLDPTIPVHHLHRRCPLISIPTALVHQLRWPELKKPRHFV